MTVKKAEGSAFRREIREPRLTCRAECSGEPNDLLSIADIAGQASAATAQ